MSNLFKEFTTMVIRLRILNFQSLCADLALDNGHALLTHSYLFRNEDPLKCIYCACRLTVKHIPIESN